MRRYTAGALAMTYGRKNEQESRKKEKERMKENNGTTHAAPGHAKQQEPESGGEKKVHKRANGFFS